MSVQISSQIAALSGLFERAGQRVTFPALDDSTLRLGEIVRMRVMRQVSDQRYAMQTNGKEHIVDSTIPFSTGDVFFGKVVGVGAQVELERVRVERGNVESGVHRPVDGAKDAAFEKAGALPLQGALQTPLTQAELSVIAQSARGPNERALATLAAMALRNIGLAVTKEALRAVLALVADRDGSGLFLLDSRGREESADTAQLTRQSGDIQHENSAVIFAPLLKCLVEDFPEQAHGNEMREASNDFIPSGSEGGSGSAQAGTFGQDAGSGEPELDAMRRLFNAESGSSLTHRINTIPLLINGRLVELNMALFDERREQRKNMDEGVPRYQSIVLSMNLPSIGRLEMRVGVSGKALKVDIRAENERVAETFSSYSSLLRESLAERAWTISDLHYRHGCSEADPAGESVLHHLAALDRHELYL